MTPATGSGAASRRFEALDGLRGLSALMVVLLHLPLTGALHDIPLIRHAYLFVDFFFVLSGFVIAHAWGTRLRGIGDFKAFAWSRLARIYPLHLAMLLLFLAFELATLAAKGPDGAFQGGNTPPAFAANLLLVHAFGTVHSLGWNYPSWSISAELAAYLLFALGLCLLGVRRLSPLLPVVAVAALLGLFRAAGTMDATVDFGWLRCLAGFALGAFLRLRLIPDGPAPATSPGLAWTLVEIATAAIVVAFVSVLGASAVAFAAPVLFTFAVAVFSREAGWIGRILKCREARFLGLVSYSVYMTHAFVISRLVNLAGAIENRTGLDLLVLMPDGSKSFSALASPLAATGTILATLVFSALAHRFVERPGHRFRPSFARPSPGRAGVSA